MFSSFSTYSAFNSINKRSISISNTVRVVGNTAMQSTTTHNIFEFSNVSATNASLTLTSPTLIEILAVAGGGGGGNGGGGGGEMIEVKITISDTLNITTGKGGLYPGGTNYNDLQRGSNTTITFNTNTSNNIIAIGGGSGNNPYNTDSTGTIEYGESGGSGGGGGNQSRNNQGGVRLQGTYPSGGDPTGDNGSYGNNGGNGGTGGGTYGCGGGGGAGGGGGQGTYNSNNNRGTGGNGAGGLIPTTYISNISNMYPIQYSYGGGGYGGYLSGSNGSATLAPGGGGLGTNYTFISGQNGIVIIAVPKTVSIV